MGNKYYPCKRKTLWHHEVWSFSQNALHLNILAMNVEGTTAKKKTTTTKSSYFERNPSIALCMQCVFLGCRPPGPNYYSQHVNRVSSSYLCFFSPWKSSLNLCWCFMLVRGWGKKRKENKLKYPNSSNLFLRNHVPDWHPKISTNYMLCGAT